MTKNKKVMTEKQSEFLESIIDNSVFHLQRLDELKNSGVKLSKTDKSDLEYYRTTKSTIMMIKRELQTIK